MTDHPCPQTNAAATTHAEQTLSDEILVSDNLALMRSLPDACCDLIYADPPFNANRTIGPNKSASSSYVDKHAHGLVGYLAQLKPRLTEMHRLLSDKGSLYVHVDYRSVHYTKVMLDEIFGLDHFLNEIIWSYRSGGRYGRWFARKHDTILLYAKCAGSHTFNRLHEGQYRTRDLKYEPDGTPYKSTRNGPLRFHPAGPAMSDVWDIPFLSTVSRERAGYPSQKPEALLERMVRASSNVGDVVADFFCGSGTSLVVAKRLKRRYFGCDDNPDAVRIARQRVSSVH